MEIPPLVNPQWLHDNLADPTIQVIENAWISDAYDKAHISGALKTPAHPHLKKFTANGKRSLHVMDEKDFAALCHELGLRRDRHYIIYDDFSGLFAARFWWVCHYFGVRNISVLNGSWRGWLDRQYPVSSRLEQPETGGDVEITPQPDRLIDREELRSIHRSPDIQIWDTRREGEYSGDEETDNQRRGHIPGSLNLVWTELLVQAPYPGGPRFLKPLTELEQQLTDLGLRRDRTIITYCQSGIRASFCIFVLMLLGFPRHRLYDASMREWANLSETPLSSGTSS